MYIDKIDLTESISIIPSHFFHKLVLLLSTRVKFVSIYVLMNVRVSLMYYYNLEVYTLLFSVTTFNHCRE